MLIIIIEFVSDTKRREINSVWVFGFTMCELNIIAVKIKPCATVGLLER